ncbi:hypothetical protein AGMMS50230_11600 [Spirochaetia bacterium]|nr:hypothetical protein AGMMS50230_11600 [Spirochaetia bacterium]
MDLLRLFPQLGNIEGLDFWEGLSHVGCSREVYAGTLRLFCGELEKKAAAIAGFLGEENWKDYTTFVHAVKGGLAGIGAWELAQKALELEDASREGNYAFCQRHSAAILEEMEVLTTALRSTVLFRKEAGPKKEVSAVFMEQKLAELYDACSLGNSAKAEALAKELEASTYNNEIDTLVESITVMVENLDYDLALEVLENRRKTVCNIVSNPVS